MWDHVLSAIGSFRVWINWMVSGLVESILDLVCLAILSWSPLELTATWFFFIVSDFYCITPLEVMALFFSSPPLEVGVEYRTGVAA